LKLGSLANFIYLQPPSSIITLAKTVIVSQGRETTVYSMLATGHSSGAVEGSDAGQGGRQQGVPH